MYSILWHLQYDNSKTYRRWSIYDDDDRFAFAALACSFFSFSVLRCSSQLTRPISLIRTSSFSAQFSFTLFSISCFSLRKHWSSSAFTVLQAKKLSQCRVFWQCSSTLIASWQSGWGRCSGGCILWIKRRPCSPFLRVYLELVNDVRNVMSHHLRGVASACRAGAGTVVRCKM